MILAQVIFGTAGIFARYALSGTGPINAVFLRLFIAAPFALILARIGKRDLHFDTQMRYRLVAAGCILGLHFALWVTALQYVSVVVATLLVCTTPFWLALYDTVILKRALPRVTVAAFAVAAVATVVVVAWGPKPSAAGDQPLLGAALSLGASFLIALYLVLMREVGQGRSSLSLIAYAYPSTLLIMAPLALIAHEPLPTTWVSWGGILGMAFITQLVGHTALATALRSFSSTTVAFTGLSEPPIGALAAALLLAEPLQAQVIIGGIVLLATISVVLAQEKEPAPDLLGAGPA